MTLPTVPIKPLSPARWRQLEPLLDRVLDLDTEARRRFLDELSLASQELRCDLEWCLQQQGESAPLESASGRGRSSGERRAAGGDRYLGRRVGPFMLTEQIGAGGMGAVYRGERVEGGFRQTVAIKLILGSHPEVLERFGRERQILADLRHPRIAQLLDGGETDDGMPYFAMEFVAGRNLDAYADATGADIEGRIRLLLQVAEALAYAHRQKVLHRDIKPSNIVVGDDGQVKLLDFGIARLLESSEHTALTVDQMGPMTPDYAAPEQFSGGPLGAATDIYQFGTLMFRLLSGRLPLRSTGSGPLAWARAVVEQPPQSLREALREAGEISRQESTAQDRQRRFRAPRLADLECLLAGMLAKAPADRYRDMPAVIDDLQAYLDGRRVKGTTSTSRPRRFAVRRRSRLLWAALLSVMALAVWRWAPTFQDPWMSQPALAALGLSSANLHGALDETEELFRQALIRDANGDRPGALALLESLHHSDPTTPVAAMLLGYWSRSLGPEGDASGWFVRAEQRMAGVADPYLDLLLKFLRADSAGEPDASLRYSTALLELRPQAWFLRLARAHHLGSLGMREAATRELAAIDVDRLDHRKLVDAIADRGSYGDLAGAKAQFDRFPAQPDDPKYLDLQARLRYSSGDLRGARDGYLEVVDAARRIARLDLEGRGLLYAGAFSLALDEPDAADPLLRQAQRRLTARRQFALAADAALALAQIAASASDAPALQHHLGEAVLLAESSGNPAAQQLVALHAARLGRPLNPAPAAEAASAAGLLILEAHRQRDQGDLVSARARYRSALIAAEDDPVLSEELALLARSLGEPLPSLPPIDPPFAPYARFAARWALSLGDSVVPERSP